MTRDRIELELNAWLDTSVRDLPEDVKTYTREELLNHYQDAVASYSDEGMSRYEAHDNAMRDLGAADLVATGLHDAHLGYRLYIAGMIASMCNLTALIGLPVAYLKFGLGERMGFVPFSIMTDLILLSCTVVALLALQQLLYWRFNRRDLVKVFRLVISGLALQITADIAGLQLFGYSHNVDMHHARSIFESNSLLQIGISGLSMIGFLALGVGLVWIAIKLRNVPEALYGLAPLVVGLFAVLGAFIGTSFVWITIPRSQATALAGLIVIVSHLVIWPALTLLFYRAAYRPFMLPRRLA